MRRNDYPITILPDIEMYGGDTEPWNVLLIHEDGRSYLYSEAVDYLPTLTITEYMYSAGLGIPDGTYVVQKTGTIQLYNAEDAAASFSFVENDTKNLSGRFTYQIEISHGDAKRIGQGSLFIKNNINRQRG